MKRVLILFVVFISARVFALQEPGLKFIENKNQWTSSVDYAARIPGGNMMLSPGKFSYYFIDKKKIQELHEETSHEHPESGFSDQQFINAHAVEVMLVGANSKSKPQAFGKSSEYYNFYVGSDPSQWASKAFAYDGVLYSSIYTGIDLKIYSKGKNLKYDFVVAPSADPSQILIQYDGADALNLDNGNLTIKTSLGEMTERRPFVFQYIDGRKVEVISEYILHGNKMSFYFPNGYDACYELVIDPLLIFSTYSGSEADNWGSTATPGEHGNLYSAGVTNQFVNTNTGVVRSGDFPATDGAFQVAYGGLFDVGILKYDSSGKQLLYASYLGGSSNDSPHSLLMNNKGQLIVLGTTSSTNFATTNGVFDRSFNFGPVVVPIHITYENGSDIFVSRINKDGTALLASTFIGGTGTDGLNEVGGPLWKNYGDEQRGDVIADDLGNIYIVSVTNSNDFPVSNSFNTVYKGNTDGVLVKLDSGLTQIIWSAFVGGTGTDALHTIKFDSLKNIYIAGGTTSTDFPGTANGFQPALSTSFGEAADGWIAHVSKNGSSVLHATYTGTSDFDQVYFLDLNTDGEVYVYGQTSGTMPITDGLYGKPGGQLLQKFTSDLSTRIYSTTFGSGGDPNISPTAFLVTDCNTIYMAGWGGLINEDFGGWDTNTFGLEISADAEQPTTTGSDFYFIVLSEDATKFTYGTYLGGTQSATHVDGGTSRFDKEGVVYHAVCSGCSYGNASHTHTSDFPTTPNVWSRSNNSLNCNNAAFKFDLASLKARLDIQDGITQLCLPDKFKFNNLSSGGIVYYWDFGDGTKLSRSETVSLEHEYKNPGTYTVSLVAFDPSTCTVSDTTTVKVSAHIPLGKAQSDDIICSGTEYPLKATGGVSYHWRSADGTFQSDDERPVIIARDTAQYFVEILESSGCVHTEDFVLTVVPDVHPDFEIIRESSCTARSVILVKSLTDSTMLNDDIFFDFGDGTTSDATEVEHFYEQDSVYTIKQVGVRGPCTFLKSFEVPVFTMKVPNMITPGEIDGKNDVFTIQFGKEKDGVIRTPGDYGFDVSLSIYNRWGKTVYHNNDYRYDWSAENQAAGVYYYEVKIEDHVPCKSWLQVIK